MKIGGTVCLTVQSVQSVQSIHSGQSNPSIQQGLPWGTNFGKNLILYLIVLFRWVFSLQGQH